MTIFFTSILVVFVLKSVPEDANVFICDSNKAKSYHSDKDCRDIKDCKEIKEVSLQNAKDVYKRVACKICCK